jgi:hypothetical protein
MKKFLFLEVFQVINEEVIELYHCSTPKELIVNDRVPKKRGRYYVSPVEDYNPTYELSSEKNKQINQIRAGP